MPALQSSTHRVKTIVSDIARGLFDVCHNGFALLGIVMSLSLIVFFNTPQLRKQVEQYAVQWLVPQQMVTTFLAPSPEIESNPEANDRATAINPNDLPKQQVILTQWLSRKYRVAPEPVAALVSEAFRVGEKTKVDPTLILAVMAIESGFNPFAQSPVGAQGLMQVLTKVHTDKYENYGGKLAAFDPLSNLQVGVKVLQDCINRAGSIEEGLKHYVGAANLDSDGGYANKVLSEQARLRLVVQGQKVEAAAMVRLPTVNKTAATNEPIAIDTSNPSLNLEPSHALQGNDV